MKTIKTFFYNLKLELYKTRLRKLWLYLKYHQEIDGHYGYSLKEGWASEETADWHERTLYWLRSE